MMFWRSFSRGLADMAPVLTAFVPIGMLWGALAAAKGLTPAEAGLMSAFVFAGASQFVAVEMWHDPVPVLLLGFTAFIVNVRHFLMSASISRHMPGFSFPMKALGLYILCDETWAVAERRALGEELTVPYYFGVALSAWVTWLIASITGAVIGMQFGDPAAYGIDFAFAALFIAILAGFWKGPRTGAVLAASAAAAAVAKLTIGGAWYIVIGGMCGVAVAALLHVEREEEADGVRP